MSKRLTIEEFIETLKSSGSGSGVLVVNIVAEDADPDATHLDKTWQEIHDAIGRVVVRENLGDSGIDFWYSTVDVEYSPGAGYLVFVGTGDNSGMYVASSPEDYPAASAD